MTCIGLACPPAKLEIYVILLQRLEEQKPLETNT